MRIARGVISRRRFERIWTNVWVESCPDVADREWWKNFGVFKRNAAQWAVGVRVWPFREWLDEKPHYPVTIGFDSPRFRR